MVASGFKVGFKVGFMDVGLDGLSCAGQAFTRWCKV
jgi:hypothetical protein